MTTSRVKWVDIAKFFAILAVLIDHTNNTLYSNNSIAFFSYYSVGLFILVMGVTFAWSYERKNVSVLRNIYRKSKGILVPYAVATFIYLLFFYKAIDVNFYLERLIKFDICTPFYYVLLYVQLVLVSPLVYYWLSNTINKKYGVIWRIIGGVFVTLISIFTTGRSDIFGVYGGGGKLFGGTFLILLYMGMWFGLFCKQIKAGLFVSVICFSVLTILTIFWWRVIYAYQYDIDSKFPFGEGGNPPSISLGVYSILVCLALFWLEKVIDFFPNTLIEKLAGYIADIGKHTLYIFLYHYLILFYIIPNISTYYSIEIRNIWIKRILYFFIMIAGSMIIEYLLNKVQNWMRKAYVIK